MHGYYAERVRVVAASLSTAGRRCGRDLLRARCSRRWRGEYTSPSFACDCLAFFEREVARGLQRGWVGSVPLGCRAGLAGVCCVPRREGARVYRAVNMPAIFISSSSSITVGISCIVYTTDYRPAAHPDAGLGSRAAASKVVTQPGPMPNLCWRGRGGGGPWCWVGSGRPVTD